MSGAHARSHSKASTSKIRRRRNGRGALLVVTMMLAGSGVLRFAGGPGHVLAEEIDELMVPDKAPSPNNTQAEGPPHPDPDISAILAALDLRESRLEAREAAVADKIAALNLAESEIRKNLVALEEAEARLAGLMALSEEAAEGDLERLTAVFESMKPKDAAALFEEMAPEFAAGFLGRMRPDLAAAILAGLKPETAYTVSVILAGRNANAPTQ